MGFNGVIFFLNGKHFQKWNQIFFLKEKHYKKFALSNKDRYKKTSIIKLRNSKELL
jgi:hypothetical protein